MNALPAGSPIVIYVNGSPYGDTVTVEGSQTSGPSSGARAGYDAYQVHRDFPARWQAYIVANYRNIGHVTNVFGVSERTARNWWKGSSKDASSAIWQSASYQDAGNTPLCIAVCTVEGFFLKIRATA